MSNGDVHTYPVNDLIEYDTEHEDDCLCGPTVEAVPRDDGSYGWLYVHHSLDGREKRESVTEEAPKPRLLRALWAGLWCGMTGDPSKIRGLLSRHHRENGNDL